MGVISTLYRGEQRVDFYGRRRVGLVISVALLVVGGISVAVQGLDFSIEFRGGAVWEVPANDVGIAEVRSGLTPLGLEDATIQRVSPAFGGEGVETIRVTAGVEATERTAEITDELAALTGADVDDISINEVGPTWGEEISRSALRALVFFFLAIAAYISLRFEWKMAVAALAAVAHDILVTIGIYSLFSFDISPATAIAFLTILGYSLYDTIVVFDKVGENVAVPPPGQRALTYAEGVNNALNEVLMRSVNTTVTSLMPITSLIVIGSLLGAATLQDFALVLLIGLAVGAYSSLFVAAPVLVWLKEREPRNQALRERAESRTGAVAPTGGRNPGPAAPAGRDDGGDEVEVPFGSDRTQSAGPARTTPPAARGPIEPRGRKKGRRR
ncbi:MAG TPA: protein translocase subunit SecF [Acidimicrobiales bacterium]|nr:protein translocase subunit SecF [Acidimicrobiales bacterium]